MLGCASAQSITIEHMYGSTTLPDVPERIVTVGLTDQGAVIALGTIPIASTGWIAGRVLWPWSLEKLGDGAPEPVNLDRSAIDYERILELQPDVILSLFPGRSEEEYKFLSEIAPTVVAPLSDEPYVSWQEQTRIVGKVLRKSAEAEQLVTEIETRLEQIRQDHPEVVGSTALIATDYSDLYVYGDGTRSGLLTGLGFKIPEDLAEALGEVRSGLLSRERIDLLDTDALVWIDTWPGERLIADPLYQQLPVHREGREVFLGSSTEPLAAASSFVTVLSLPYLLDELVPRLEAAVDGDPATLVEPPAEKPAEE